MVNNHSECQEIYDKIRVIGVIIAQNETWVLLGHPRGLLSPPLRKPYWTQGAQKEVILDTKTNPFSDFFCFFACLNLHDFYIFVHAIFIGFWTPHILRFAVNNITKSTFSCFETIFILDDF